MARKRKKTSLKAPGSSRTRPQSPKRSAARKKRATATSIRGSNTRVSVPALPSLSKEAEAAWAKLDRVLSERRQKYQDFVASIRHLPSLERAEAWLRYIAEDSEEGDEEATVYLRSRNNECTSEIDSIISRWKEAARYTIETAARGSSIYNADTGQTTKVGQIPVESASRILAQSSATVPDFWYRHEYGWNIDATMLRTVEWCDIGGFDDWWERLARDEYEASLHGGIDPIPASYWLFSMSRSAYACALLKKSVELRRAALAFPTQGAEPWEFYHQFNHPKFTLGISLAYAANVGFAEAVLGGATADKVLLDKVAEVLIQNQSADGHWNLWADVETPSAIVTATAIHALAAIGGRGAKRAIENGAKWLLSVQSPDGCWSGPEPIRDVTHATVLCVDALALSREDRVTTLTTLSLAASSSPATNKSARRFRVALTFPGELRARVGRIATILASAIPKKQIFYDKWYEAELAKPNLDLHLQSIYGNDSDLLVVFLSEDYDKKDWPRLEFRPIRDIIKRRQRDDDIMFIRAENAEVGGVFSIDGYISLNEKSDAEIAALIVERLQAS
jgi:hypothetical protein